MTVPVEDWLLTMLAQTGDVYVFGAEADPLDPDPDEWDCSELGQWAGDRCGVVPPIPDGSAWQWQHVRNLGLEMSVDAALATRGAALFHFTAGVVTHVAYSIGHGLTIEARGARWGVGTWPGYGRFHTAGLFPGIDYTPRPPYTEDTFMQTHDITITDQGMHEARPMFAGGPLAPLKAWQVVTIEPLDDTVKRVAVQTANGDLLLQGPGRYLVCTHG